MKKDIKLCKDCVHFAESNSPDVGVYKQVCRRPLKEKINYVTGEPNIIRNLELASVERESRSLFKCGRKGRFFKQKQLVKLTIKK